MCCCDRPERPRCGFHGCWESADWSYLHPAFPRGYAEHFRFACNYHFQLFIEFQKQRIPGLDRPQYADDYWRASVIEMTRLAIMKLNHEDLKQQQFDEINLKRHRKFSPQQRAALETLRRIRGDYGTTSQR